jgi:hypothetical protein
MFVFQSARSVAGHLLRIFAGIPNRLTIHIGLLLCLVRRPLRYKHVLWPHNLKHMTERQIRQRRLLLIYNLKAKRK